MILIRRTRPTPPPQCSSLCHRAEPCSVSINGACDAGAKFSLGDTVVHAEYGQGVVDTMVTLGPMNRWTYWVSRWDGRGAPPALYVADRYPASAKELKHHKLQPAVILRRR